jgi:hypothetical protein
MSVNMTNTDSISPPCSPDEIQRKFADSTGGKQNSARQLQERFARAMEIAKEMFADAAQIEEQEDPDVADFRYVVVTVHPSGDPADIVARECEWHNRLEQLQDPAMRDLRLAIYPNS